MVCKACSARGPIAVGAETNPVRERGKGALLEFLHTGPQQPCSGRGALVVTLAMLLRLINCRFIIIIINLAMPLYLERKC